MIPVRQRGASPIEVWKGSGQRYHSILTRSDGVVVRLEGGSYNKIGGPVGRVPHDIAHLIVETHFGLEHGLWGVLAAGGIVQNASLVGGRLPPHAMRRAKAITDRAGEQLRQAEVLVRAVADLSLGNERPGPKAMQSAVGGRWDPGPVTAETLSATSDALRDAALRWSRLSSGETFEMAWRR